LTWWRGGVRAAVVACTCVALTASDVHAAPQATVDAPPAQQDDAASIAQTGESAQPRAASQDTPTADVSPPPEQASLDAAWQGVEGYDVKIVLDDGTAYTGRVSALQKNTFTLIDYDGGIVRVIPKATVRDLRVRIPGETIYPPPDLPEQTGSGLIAGGVLLTVLGAPVFLSGLVIFAIEPSATGLTLPLLLTGGAGLGSGIPMLVVGSRRRRAYQRALNERNRPTPTLGFTRHGWTAGVSLRF
jgi:hypothetical protein